MNNVCKSCQHGESHLMYLEPIQNIKIISHFYPSDHILVYDKYGRWDVRVIKKGAVNIVLIIKFIKCH